MGTVEKSKWHGWKVFFVSTTRLWVLVMLSIKKDDYVIN